MKNYLKNKRLLTDGSFGTYYASKYELESIPELDNELAPERIAAIHSEYIAAGAKLIRTNTFACNTIMLDSQWDKVEQNIKAAIKIAKEITSKAAEDNISNYGSADADKIYIAGDIGPIPASDTMTNEAREEEYYKIAKTFVQEGINILSFETFSDITAILPTIKKIKKENDTFVIVSFSVNQFGYTEAGLSARKLLKDAAQIEEIDAIGLNCGVGPGHMEQVINTLPMDYIKEKGKYFVALPNAGYPKLFRSKIIFEKNPEYFAQKVDEFTQKYSIAITGGCCGTTPYFIELLNGKLKEAEKNKLAAVGKKSEQKESEQKESEQKESEQKESEQIELKQSKETIGNNTKLDKREVQEDPSSEAQAVKITRKGFIYDSNGEVKTRKLIAVELAPPLGADDEKIMNAAKFLNKMEVDVVTFPDSPSGRTRIDSVLMAEKIRRETGLTVMPHICCRDKNAIAMRSLFLGSHINDIHNMLIITGDPIPSMVRQTTKAVFNFDSVGLMNIAGDMNEEVFGESPMCYGGAINQGRKNLDVEIGRVKKKMAAGAEFFLSQPVFSSEDAERLKTIKEATGARILAGIMPLISRKNAMFMKNEIAGVDVTQELINRYPENATKEEGEAVGIEVAKEMMDYTKNFVDGYYFSFPFNRVYMLENILK